MTQTYKVQVSMNQAHIVESGFVWKQGDFGFNIEIEVLDFDTTGATPQIIFRKSTGAVEATEITRAGNKFTYAIRGTELDTPGPCVCDLKLNDSTTKRVSTASFKYFVIPDTMDGLNQQASSYSDTIAGIVADFDDDVERVEKANNVIDYVNVIKFSEPGKLIITKDSTVDITDIVTDSTPGSTVRYAVVDCQENDVFTINGHGASGGRLWCFIDASGNNLAKADALATVVNKQITAPPSAAKLVLNTLDNGICYKGTNTIDEFRVMDDYTKSLLSQLDGIDILEFSTGGTFLITNGSTVDITDHRCDNLSSAIHYSVTSCSEGDVFVINGTGGNAPRLWCFIDASGNVLSVSDANATASNTIIHAPKDTAKLVVNSTTNGLCYKLSRIEDKTNKEFIASTLQSETIAFNEKGKYIKTNGDTVDIYDVITAEPGSQIRYAIVDCQAEDVFTINGTGGNASRLYCFIDASGNVLEAAHSGTIGVNLVLVAPPDSAKLIINNTGGACYKGKNITREIESKDIGNDPALLANTGFEKITFSERTHYIVTSSSPVDITNIGRAPSTDGIRYAITNCKEFDIFVINGTGGNGPRLWCFIDGNNQILKNAAAYATASNAIIMAPTGAAKIIINSNDPHCYKLENSKLLSIRATQLNDGMSMTCSFDNTFIYDDATGIMGVLSKGGWLVYGEQDNVITLDLFPLTQPNNIRHCVVAKAGEEIAPGITFSSAISNGVNGLLVDTGVYRIVFGSNDKVYYRDYDFATNTFTDAVEVKANWNSEQISVTAANRKLIASSFGYDDSSSTLSYLISHLRKESNGKYYVCWTGLSAHPIICYSDDDFETITPFAAYPDTCQYEAAVVYYDSKLNVIERRGSQVSIGYSTDDGATWTTQMVDSDDNRPRLYVYKDKLHWVYGKKSSGRTTLIVKIGNDFSTAETKEIYNPYMLVYPSLYYNNGFYYLIFSDSQTSIAMDNSQSITSMQGKDATKIVVL